jgi:hypothetical protein
MAVRDLQRRAMNRIRIVVSLVFFGTIFSVADTLAQGITDTELLALPPYCYARLKGDEAEKRPWEQRMGQKQFVHLHHYCFGLNLMNRAAVELDQNARRRYLQRAAGEFNYVLKRWPPEFPLTSDAMNRKVQAEMMAR